MNDKSVENRTSTFGYCTDCLCRNLAQSSPAMRLLGLCPLLAVTTSVLKALTISLLLLLVSVLSSGIGTLLQGTIFWRLKPLYFAILASVSTMIVVNGVGVYFPLIVDSLGIYALLIAANCQVISQLQELAEHASFTRVLSLVARDGFWVLLLAVVVALIREVVAFGTVFHDWPLLFGVPVKHEANGLLPFVAEPAGALIIFGLLLGALNVFTLPRSEAEPQENQL
jgi:electron transport complex protein RnfE